jgi:hypothetical protein
VLFNYGQEERRNLEKWNPDTRLQEEMWPSKVGRSTGLGQQNEGNLEARQRAACTQTGRATPPQTVLGLASSFPSLGGKVWCDPKKYV